MAVNSRAIGTFSAAAQLLIIDEIGYLSVGASANNLFFQLVNARYEKGAMILTSNRGLAEWGEVFGDPSSPRPCSTDCCITPSSCRSRAPATGYLSTPTCWHSRAIPARPPRSSRRHVVAAGRPSLPPPQHTLPDPIAIRYVTENANATRPPAGR